MSRLAALAALLVLAVGLVVFVVGVVRNPVLLLLLVANALAVWGLQEFVTRRGMRRNLGALAALVGLVGAVLIVTFAGSWPIVLTVTACSVAGWALSGLATRPTPYHPPERSVAPPRSPFFLMNRWSGGGKVDRFALDEKARQLGATVQILEKDMDVVSVLEDAVSGGADLLGAAGGDGTQALVAKVAAAHGLPMVVVPAGTRNHFALDLGLDREDPSAALDALSDGVEISIDLGDVGGRPFVNNVSFGLYADIIRRPEYRDAKVDTTLTTLPEVLAADSPPTGLHAERPDGSVIDHPRVVFVGNNPYAKSDDPTPAGTRPRLDTGQLGVDIIAYHSSAEFRALVRAIEMRRTDLGGSRVTWTAPTVTVSDDRGTVSAGVDGEYVEFDSPVILRSRPGALRVRVPADRPGLKASWPPMDEHLFSHLWHILRDGGSAR